MTGSEPFRAERLARISSGDTPVSMHIENGKIILHIVPLSAFSIHNPVDLEKAYQLHGKLRPLSASGLDYLYNFDGVINFTGGERCFSYTQLFRNG